MKPEIITAEDRLKDDEELAGKMFAAFYAHITDVKSIDRVLKNKVEPALKTAPVGEKWLRLAREAKLIARDNQIAGQIAKVPKTVN